MKITGHAAIEYAITHGLPLNKYEDPTEPARAGLTVAEAREVARQDAGLVYVDALAVGDRVEARDDNDAGNVLRLEAGRALVGWDTGVKTWTAVADLVRAR